MEDGESASLLMSLIYIIIRRGPRMDPCGTTGDAWLGEDLC